MQTNPLQQFQQLRTKKLKETIYTGELPLDNFNLWKEKALGYESRASLQVSFEELQNLHTKTNSYTFFEIALLLNCLEERTPIQLKELTAPYLEVQQQISSIAKNWNELVKPIEQDLAEELQKQFEAMKAEQEETGGVVKSLKTEE